MERDIMQKYFMTILFAVGKSSVECPEYILWYENESALSNLCLKLIGTFLGKDIRLQIYAVS